MSTMGTQQSQLQQSQSQQSLSQQDQEHRETIHARKMEFPFDRVIQKFWFGGNPIISAYFSSLSATFPPGEKKFIESVRAYQDKVTDPFLKKQIKGFIGQEAQHSLQHRKVNQEFERLGLNVNWVEKNLEKHLQQVAKKFPDKVLLASTAGMEHITAIMSAFILSHPEVLDPAGPVMKDLFLWHGVEEIEHKSVAFDVYMECVGDRSLLRKVMFFQTLEFVFRQSFYLVVVLVKARTLPRWGHFTEAWRFFLGKKGFWRRIFRPYLRYYKKDFHPDKVDDSSLIDAWKRHAEPASQY